MRLGLGSPRIPARGALALLALCSFACTSVDPKTTLQLMSVEGYWVVNTEKSPTNYITPTIRFDLKNASTLTLTNIEATTTFRRKGEFSVWGDTFLVIANHSRPLGPGQTTAVEMRSSADYYTPGGPVDPEIMFHHGLFRDATADVFVRIGRGGLVKMASLEVPRRLAPRVRDH